jgi:tRNA U34 5-carboxymethylaminomethyl modifying GTPase MnmE/TrmE
MKEETIYALSTGYIKSAICIVRVSGYSALDSLKILTNNKKFEISKATLTNLYDYDSNLIDQGIVIVFKKECAIE